MGELHHSYRSRSALQQRWGGGAARLASAPQATLDLAGNYTDQGSGVFVYTFSTALPKDFDRNATYRVGGQVSRGGRRWVANDTFDFVPSGAPVVETKDLAETKACDHCHDLLPIHAGSATTLTSIVRWKECISLVKKVYL